MHRSEGGGAMFSVIVIMVHIVGCVMSVLSVLLAKWLAE